MIDIASKYVRMPHNQAIPIPIFYSLHFILRSFTFTLTFTFTFTIKRHHTRAPVQAQNRTVLKSILILILYKQAHELIPSTRLTNFLSSFFLAVRYFSLVMLCDILVVVAVHLCGVCVTYAYAYAYAWVCSFA